MEYQEGRLLEEINAKLAELIYQQRKLDAAGWFQTVVEQLTRIENVVSGKRLPTMLRADIRNAQWLNKKTGVVTMSGTVNATDDHDVRVPLKWSDDVGSVSAPATGTVATSDTVAVVSAVDVAADDMSLVCRVAGDGTANVTVTNGVMTDTFIVVVGPPVASKLSADAADAVMVAKGTAA